MKPLTTLFSAVIILLISFTSTDQLWSQQTINPYEHFSFNKSYPNHLMNLYGTDPVIKNYDSQITAEFDTIYSENFDNGSPDWTFQDLWSQSFWHTSTTGALSGYSYWCGIEALNGYDDNWVQTLTSPSIDLTGTTAPVLTFNHYFRMEPFSGIFSDFDAYDAVSVRISTDGENFSIIAPSEGLEYNAQNAIAFYLRFGNGLGGWSDNSGSWISSGFNLDAYHGQNIWIQFLFGSDNAYSSQYDPTLFGWRVDDIQVKDGNTMIFEDDAGDSGDAQFIAGGPGGPNPWHLSAQSCISPPHSAGCFDSISGKYLPGMNAAIVSPHISLESLNGATKKLIANFQVKGSIDNTIDDHGFYDLLMADVREYKNNQWSYWYDVSGTPFLPNTFSGYNESTFFDLDLTYFLEADSIQFRIYFITLPDDNVAPNSNIFIDNFTLTGRLGYEGEQFGTFYDHVLSTPFMERQTIADSFMSVMPTCPLIEENSIVTYLYQGDASAVNIPGEINGWYEEADPMIKIPGTDLWFLQFRYEADARLEYKFYINDQSWINDPLNPNTTNIEYNNSVVMMPDYELPLEIEYHDDIPHGTIFDTVISSEILGNSRTVKVYTPPLYQTKTDKSYPVILFHDGTAFLSLAKANNVIDNLIREYEIQHIIAVFVPPVNRDDEYAFDLTSAFEAFIIDELMPIIDSKFRTLDDPANRAMLGISYGGLITTQICYNRSEDFGLCAALSPAFFPKNLEVLQSVINGPVKDIDFYMDWGTYEYDVMVFSKMLKNNLEAMNYNLVWNEWHEGHNWSNWRAHLDEALKSFFPAVSGIEDNKITNPFKLVVSPNPFDQKTAISFELSKNAFVNLTIYDLSGKEIYTLLNKEHKAGQYQVNWNGNNNVGSSLNNGVYLCRLKVNNVEISKKIILYK